MKNIHLIIWFIEFDLYRRYVTMNTPVMSHIYIYITQKGNHMCNIHHCKQKATDGVLQSSVVTHEILQTILLGRLWCLWLLFGFWGWCCYETERNEWMCTFKKTNARKSARCDGHSLISSNASNRSRSVWRRHEEEHYSLIVETVTTGG